MSSAGASTAASTAWSGPRKICDIRAASGKVWGGSGGAESTAVFARRAAVRSDVDCIGMGERNDLGAVNTILYGSWVR